MTGLDAIDLVLGSTSPYRREQLSRLTANFRVVKPEVDETPRADELPRALAVRLATAKADAVVAKCPGAIVIGSDQVADLDGQPLGKPGTVENAVRQLVACAGKTVVFHSAICVVDARTQTHAYFEAVDTTRVTFREIGEAEIRRYVERENPLDCAGAFKSEGLGIALFESIHSTDPTALVGLPMIALCALLRRAGVTIL
jgi:septum formation protein